MMATTLLAFIVIQALWQWSKYTSMAFCQFFLTIDLTFLSSNSLKDTYWRLATPGRCYRAVSSVNDMDQGAQVTFRIYGCQTNVI